ncbi:hypothetical protein B0H34DRAFT_722179 [Crassisporium funariophilum]|nr:hypothetical protein B0H34DRAFT_722179 [Crassisporium funariophilum]
MQMGICNENAKASSSQSPSRAPAPTRVCLPPVCMKRYHHFIQTGILHENANANPHSPRTLSRAPAPTRACLRLPLEILANIFREVAPSSPFYNTPSLDDPPNPGAFPYSIVRVCKSWRNAAYSVPEFFTRVFIFVDVDNSPHELETKLCRSRTLDLSVYIVRKPHTSVLADPLEHPRVCAAMKALVPHIERCEVVSFEVLHSWSLPSVTDDLFRQAPKLHTLTMKSLLVAPTWTLRAHFNPEKWRIPARCSNMRDTTLTCHTIVDALRTPFWTKKFSKLNRKTLSVAHCTTLDDCTFTLCDLLRTFSHMGHFAVLELLGVDLAFQSCIDCNDPVRVSYQNLNFEGLSRGVLEGFFAGTENQTDLCSLYIARCQLGRIDYLAAWVLGLQDIDSGEDVVSFVRHWNGFELRLERCEGVNDDCIELLTQMRPCGTFFAKTLRKLIIVSCPSISVQALKTLVTLRKEEAAKYDPLQASDNPLPMHQLEVTGAREQLSEEDLKWFAENLEAFHWQVAKASKGFASPILSGDYSDLPLSDFESL